MVYSIQIHHAARKQILALCRQVRVAIAREIDQLVQNTRPEGCKKLKGTELWRIRSGRYRVVYAIDDNNRIIIILKIALRREDMYK